MASKLSKQMNFIIISERKNENEKITCYIYYSHNVDFTACDSSKRFTS